MPQGADSKAVLRPLDIFKLLTHSRCCLTDAKTLPGISQPFPEIFDPLNLLNSATSIQEVRRWRESEITHGRVAMLASLGWLVGEYVANKNLLVNGDGRISGTFLVLHTHARCFADASLGQPFVDKNVGTQHCETLWCCRSCY